MGTMLYVKVTNGTVYLHEIVPGAIARSVMMSLGNQEAPRSILASGTSFREDLVMKIFLWPFFFFRIKKSICQLVAKRCAGTVWIG